MNVILGAVLCTLTAAAPTTQPAASRPAELRAFCVDFNWGPGGENGFAPPGLWAGADPAEHVAWYAGLGANVIQTFAVSCNGYAWYKGGIVPEQPGLKHDFLPEVVKLGHARGMKVMGYFCIGSNTRWGKANPQLSYGTPSNPHIPFTREYLDFLCASIRDAVLKTDMDGFMIDWIWQPNGEVGMHSDPRRDLNQGRWLEAEKRSYRELMGEDFPGEAALTPELKLAYDRKATQRCWERIRDTVRQARPNCIIWLSCHNLKAPSLEGCTIFREVDWLMNENPKADELADIRRLIGPRTRLVQCLVGWGDQHDARAFLSRPFPSDLAIYGFAKPGESSLPFPIATYRSRPVESFQGNDRNIAVLARYFTGRPLDAVEPGATRPDLRGR